MLCLHVKVLEFADNEHRRICFDLAKRCQEATNFFWQQWELWHVQNRSAEQIREYLTALDSWRKRKGIAKPKLPKRTPKAAKAYSTALVGHFKAIAAGVTSSEPTPPIGINADLVLAMRDYAMETVSHSIDKPKLKVQACSAELSNLIYHRMGSEFPDLNVRTRTLLQNRLTGTVSNMHSASGALSGWMAILLCKQGRPSMIHPAPIPFDAANCKVWRDGDNYIRMSARIERHMEDGKANGVSDPFEFKLDTKGKASRYASPLYQVADGAAKLAGSSLLYDESKRRWKVLVAYEPPEEPKPELDPNVTIILHPSRRHPWTIRIGGRSRWIGGHGDHIAHRRRQVIEGRWSRQENYRAGTRNRKGHGVKSALVNVYKLEKSWRFFCKTFNEHIVSEVLSRCVEHRAGRLVLLRPAALRFLDCAGKNPNRIDSTAWPWHQFESFLRRKCARLGIELIESSQRVASAESGDRVQAVGV